MFKFETLVRFAVVSLTLVFFQSAGATMADLFRGMSGGASSSCADFNNKMISDPDFKRKAIAHAKEEYGTNLSDAELMRKLRSSYCSSATPNKLEEACRDAESEFNKASGKYSGACRNAGLDMDKPTEEGKEGSIGCSWSQNRCQCLNKGISDDVSEKYRCSEGGRSGDRITSTAGGMIDLSAARKRLEFCPHEDADDSDRYEKQVEKAQERMKEAKKKMDDLPDKAAKEQEKTNDKQNEARRKAADLQKEFAKELQEIKRRKSGEEQQAVAEMAQLREKIDQTDAQIRQIELSKLDAEVKLGEAKTAVELNCHTMASQQTAAEQTKRLTRIRGGQAVGDFSKLMNNVGVTSRERWQAVADIYYRRCLQSRPTRESKAAAQKIYESTTRQADNAISSARKMRTRLEENIAQVMSNKGCGMVASQPGVPSGETKLCRSAREANEEMIQAQSNAYNSQQQIQAEAVSAQQQAANRNQTYANDYQKAMLEVNDEQKRIDNLRAYLNLKREKSNGIGGKEAAKVLGETYGNLVSAAEQIVSCFSKQNGTSPVTPELNTKAKEFLKSVGQIPSSDIEDFETPKLTPEQESPRAAPASPAPRGTTPAGRGADTTPAAVK